ncbi:hypothetical protein [Kiloniella majae]|uniref:hypothetical protein n=1 Tax=Kiloniella majae TaxID=1938558 RepID=UPI000A2785AD|nr:hypothetical protein [Kiloniella majae]
MIVEVDLLDLFLGIGGLIVGIVGQTFLMLRWISTHFDKAHTRINSIERGFVRRDDFEQAYSRINEIKDNYVRRDDHNKEVARLEKELEAMRSDIRHGFSNLSTRIDLLNHNLSERRAALNGGITDAP